METRIIDTDKVDFAREAAALLIAGEVVAIPTETVYGLAGNAMNLEAVHKIFSAKGRPFHDPLIVHVPDQEWVGRLALPEDQSTITRLIERFWPGPLTILLPKRESVLDAVTAGLPEVALRMPANPVWRSVIQAAGVPLAAPSANRFGRISPTSASDVFRELNGRIPLIVDGGRTEIGIESTIVRPRPGVLEILRPGPITPQMLETFGTVKLRKEPSRIEAPGQMKSHYAPEKPVYLLDREVNTTEARNSALICWGPLPERSGFLVVRSLSQTREFSEASHSLFALLRELDAETGVHRIFVQPLPETGVGIAIMDRLRRAASKRGPVR